MKKDNLSWLIAVAALIAIVYFFFKKEGNGGGGNDNGTITEYQTPVIQAYRKFYSTGELPPETGNINMPEMLVHTSLAMRTSRGLSIHRRTMSAMMTQYRLLQKYNLIKKKTLTKKQTIKKLAIIQMPSWFYGKTGNLKIMG